MGGNPLRVGGNGRQQCKKKIVFAEFNLPINDTQHTHTPNSEENVVF